MFLNNLGHFKKFFNVLDFEKMDQNCQIWGKNIFREKLFFDKSWGLEIKIYRTKRGIVSPVNFNCKTPTLTRKKFSSNIQG